MIQITPAEAVASRLVNAGFSPDRVLLSGPRFQEATALWNKEVARTPAVVVRCASPEEVQAAVRVASSSGLPLSVRGGGHDWAGRAFREGGLVIDLTLMRSVEVTGDVAVVQGGASNLDLMTAAEHEGLTAVAGSVGAVGFAGLATGGGYGPLVGRFGLAADNLLGAQVVLADGRLVTADKAHEPELFWAVRGGGGNFGVITSLRVRLHPQTTFRTGLIAFPWGQAGDVLRGYANLLTDAPDALTVNAGLLSAPDGSHLVFISPTWSGSPGAGDALEGRIAALGSPVMNTVADTSYAAVLRANDELFNARGHYLLGTRTLAKLTPSAIDTLVGIGRARTSPETLVNWHHFHGAAARVPLADTAFGERRDHLMVELIARWSGGEAERHHSWVHDAVAALAPHALPGGYPNLLGPNSRDQIAHAYGPNAPRLVAAKSHYDPEGTFRAIPLPEPAGRTA